MSLSVLKKSTISSIYTILSHAISICTSRIAESLIIRIHNTTKLQTRFFNVIFPTGNCLASILTLLPLIIFPGTCTVLNLF